MRIENVPFATTDWNTIQPTIHPGETGQAKWRTVEVGNVRVRLVEYSPGYKADHWCSRGHVVFVLEGRLVTELKDGRSHTLGPGGCYQVGEGADPHRSLTSEGATLLIVD